MRSKTFAIGLMIFAVSLLAIANLIAGNVLMAGCLYFTAVQLASDMPASQDDDESEVV